MEETNIKNASRHMSEGQITIDGISYRIGKIYYSVGDDAFGITLKAFFLSVSYLLALFLKSQNSFSILPVLGFLRLKTLKR